MSKTLIVTGGSINVAWAKEWLDNQTFDYCIAADSGLEYADKLGLKVDFLLGDYDSVDKMCLTDIRVILNLRYILKKKIIPTHILRL